MDTGSLFHLRPQLAFTDQPRSVEDLFWFIAQTKSGNRVLSEFIQLEQSGKVCIRHFPETVAIKLQEVRGDGQPPGAALIIDGDKGTIYLDLRAEIAVLTPFLFHEMVHSLDARLWNTAMRKDRIIWDQTLLAAEKTAFEKQFIFFQELKTKFPGLGKFVLSRYPLARVLHEHLSGSDIMDMYQLTAA